MSEKRYYWLKLPKDYFKRHDIKFIKTLPNGRDIALFYIELMAESVDHDGSLRFSPGIPYSNEMLASVTDTPVDIVDVSMKTLKDLGLVEISEDGTIIIPKVIKMIGSASDTDEARRQRRCRERKKEERDKMSQKNVTSVTDDVTNNNESKSKSKSKRKSKSIKENIQEKNSSRFVPPTLDDIRSYCLERNNSVDPEKFYQYYNAGGWKDSKGQPVKNWKQKIITWEGRSSTPTKPHELASGNEFTALLQQEGYV